MKSARDSSRTVYFYDHSGQMNKKESQSVTVGLSTNAREVETTTGISVTAETGAKYKGFSASLSYQLRTCVAAESTQSSSRTVTVERDSPANGRRLAQSIWFRADRHVLERTDGTRSWTGKPPPTRTRSTASTSPPPADRPPASGRGVRSHPVRRAGGPLTPSMSVARTRACWKFGSCG
ncbi:hypothetical protein [Streptomyces sp. NPDC059256]|uniref:hypothetical protein n=1 Tax=Streptomyces sp. NPDC059256 TaxID=3346794 RepID=UPI0036CFA236